MTTKEQAANELGYELGATYLDNYWRDSNTIIDAGYDSIRRAYVVSKWSDGHTTTHSTYRDNKDIKVS